MRISALIKRIILQMIRDKRTLALLFLAPLLVLSLMYLIFNSDASSPKLGVYNMNNNIIPVLEKGKIDVRPYDKITADTITKDNLDGLLQLKDGKIDLTLQNTDPSTSKMLQMKIQQAILLSAQTQMGVDMTSQLQSNIDIHYVYGDANTSFFDVLSPVLVGFFVFFFVFLISGIGLLRERMTGTLDRLMSTPIRRSEIIMGYLIGYGLFALIQTIIVVIYSINVLDLVLVGSIWHVILINILIAFVALTLGILLSTFASSEFQMIQFIPLVVVPQVFFSGLFPLDNMATWLQSLGKIMPLYYAADALKGIMYKGQGLSEVSFDILVLTGFAILFIVLNIFALKKYRKL
ncbi:ABC transporter permease [Paenibacillus sp. N1-5-1-14]|uniref:ABC transporter permease n=1 Tax=Paenibacillus radicibacter TaxID=2972488 RepID=UPI0021599F5F|nr:ABC transporter permease [Paenibacillus radicibacter]MCR8643601.1 ABC transporter permease [Paenibacillus radicibacter]